MFKFDYQDPATFQSDSRNLKEGPASFKILEVEDSDKNGYPLVSKAGNEMIKLKISLIDQHNNRGNVYEYIVSNLAWKVHQLLASINMQHLYTPQGFNPRMLVGAQGMCEVKIQARPGFDPEPKVAKFLPFDAQRAAENHNQATQYEPLDDQIPF